MVPLSGAKNFTGDIGWDPNFRIWDGAVQIPRLYILYIVNPKLENLGNPMAGPVKF